MGDLEPRSVREGVLQAISERQWSALADLVRGCREARAPVGTLDADEAEHLEEALLALSGAQDIEHGLADERTFFEKYPHLRPGWR